MKNISLHFLLILLLLLTFTDTNALGTKIINITTGNDNSNPGQQVAYGTFDHNWTVKLPGNTNYQPVEATSCLSYGVGCNNSIRWLCPGGNPLASAPGGDYYYRMVFFYDKTSCPIQSAVINLNYVGADNIMNEISVNNNPHTVNITFNPFLSNQVIILATSEIVQGQNEIVIRVHNYANSKTGMEIAGNVTITNSAVINFDLEDQDGHPKNQFCIGAEDVVIDGTTYPINSVNNYSIDLGTVNGNNFTLIGQIGLIGGAPLSVNITDYFENQPTPITFQTGVTYRIKMKINTANCGLVESTNDFTYACCDNSTPDPTFNLSTSAVTVLKGESRVSGSHTWEVYTMPYANSGNYTLLGTFTGLTFSYAGAGPCYYVKHTVTNECGTDCDAQTICNSSCDANMECTISAPTNLNFDASTGMFTWDPVPGASHYFIEVTLDDLSCCPPADPDGPVSVHAPKIIYSSTNSHKLNSIVDLGGQMFRCFSWRVIAVCPNGTRSSSESKCVSWGAYEGNGFGKTSTPNVGKGNAETANVNVYPNPTKGMVSFEINTTKEEVCNITIMDIAGKKIESFDNMKTSNKKLSINWNTAALSQGEYLVKIVTSDNQMFVKKFIKE